MQRRLPGGWGIFRRSPNRTWNGGGLSNVTLRQWKNVEFDILALIETRGWHSESDAIYSEKPTAGDKFSGCCIALVPHAKIAVRHTESVGGRIVFAPFRGRPTNLLVV